MKLFNMSDICVFSQCQKQFGFDFPTRVKLAGRAEKFLLSKFKRHRD